MFNKLKQFKDLRGQAKQLQNTLAEEHVSLERHGINLTVNGNLEIENINLNPELEPEKQAEYLKEIINEAIQKVQKIMAEKMRGMGGLNLPGI